MTFTKTNPNYEALTTFPTAKDFASQVESKRLAILADAHAAAERWIISTLLPAVRASIERRCLFVSLPFKGEELAGHEPHSMQAHIKDFLCDKGYSEVQFKDNTLSFKVG